MLDMSLFWSMYPRSEDRALLDENGYSFNLARKRVQEDGWTHQECHGRPFFPSQRSTAEPDYRPLREREEVGRALTTVEFQNLLTAAKKSRSQSLYPALVLLLKTGMRVTELRMLLWRQVDLLGRTITVGRSKTPGGEGRMIPLNQDAFTTLVEWRAQFESPLKDHFVFPTERYGLDGEEGYL
jgi:integrase